MVTEIQIMTAFFDAMLKGYSNPKAEKSSISILPNSKYTTYRKDFFLVIDLWFKSKLNNKSFGITIIWYKLNPVWFMVYAGEYEKEAIPFLKKVLAQTYTSKKFYGGRGVPSCHDSGIHYSNNLTKNDFKDFSGKETVYKNQKIQGWHKYWGMSLI